MATIDLFRTASDVESFSAGDTIVAVGDPGDSMYVTRDQVLARLRRSSAVAVVV